MTKRKSKHLPEIRSLKERRTATHGRRIPPFEALDDVLVAREPILEMPEQEIEQFLGDKLIAQLNGVQPLTLEGAQRHQRWATRGIRHFLSEQDDNGYWDFFKIADGFLLSITDAQYRKDGRHVRCDVRFVDPAFWRDRNGADQKNVPRKSSWEPARAP